MVGHVAVGIGVVGVDGPVGAVALGALRHGHVADEAVGLDGVGGGGAEGVPGGVVVADEVGALVGDVEFPPDEFPGHGGGGGGGAVDDLYLAVGEVAALVFGHGDLGHDALEVDLHGGVLGGFALGGVDLAGDVGEIVHAGFLERGGVEGCSAGMVGQGGVGHEDALRGGVERLLRSVDDELEEVAEVVLVLMPGGVDGVAEECHLVVVGRGADEVAEVGDDEHEVVLVGKLLVAVDEFAHDGGGADGDLLAVGIGAAELCGDVVGTVENGFLLVGGVALEEDEDGGVDFEFVVQAVVLFVIGCTAGALRGRADAHAQEAFGAGGIGGGGAANDVVAGAAGREDDQAEQGDEDGVELVHEFGRENAFSWKSKQPGRSWRLVLKLKSLKLKRIRDTSLRGLPSGPEAWADPRARLCGEILCFAWGSFAEAWGLPWSLPWLYLGFTLALPWLCLVRPCLSSRISKRGTSWD